jgi:hypothetical protein
MTNIYMIVGYFTKTPESPEITSRDVGYGMDPGMSTAMVGYPSGVRDGMPIGCHGHCIIARTYPEVK